MTKSHAPRSRQVLYTAKVHSAGGRDGGQARTDDGRLDLTFSSPGGPGTGTNPEQLFAAGWAACYIGALGVAARKQNLKLPADTTDDVEVDLCMDDGGYSLQARHRISLPGLPAEAAQALVDAAAAICPYSKATKDAVPVTYTLA